MPSVTNQASGRARRALVHIVDDDAAVRDALTFALRLEGLDARAYDGAAALLEAGDPPPGGCLVVDFAMPVTTGLELVEALRRRGIELPVILIAGYVDADLRHRAALVGVAHVLEKPLADSSLVELIRASLAAGE
ncbi:MAG: response regulator [Rhodospirillales bacterium]|nr:MAG: response regulator [Rhodospirillales bacterium]